MELHQRSNLGNTVIMQYMLDWFRMPKDFDSTLWLSQILQGLAITYAVEHWRRNMPRCMGALYWQLNDCWPVASWASLDWHGRWKALQHMARRFFAPVLVSGVEDAKRQTLDVHVSSDRGEPAAGRLVWTATTVEGRTVARGVKAVRVPARSSRRVARLSLSGAVAKAGGARNLLVWLELSVGGKIVSRNLSAFAKPKHMELGDAEIEASVKAVEDGAFAVTLEAKRPALYVWLELEDADALMSDNFFHLRPGAPITALATPAREMTAARFRKALRVRSLTDTYR
jgi:beta-mannosidase